MDIIQPMKRVSQVLAALLMASVLVPLPVQGLTDVHQDHTTFVGPEAYSAAPMRTPVQFIPEVDEETGVLPPLAKLPATRTLPANHPHWDPGDPFDNWAWVRVNDIKDVNTGQTEPVTSMPPTEYEVVNVSVVNKCPGPAPNCDPSMDVIKLARITMMVWFPNDPLKPVYGEAPMYSKNGSANRDEWWGEIGGGGSGGKVWPLPKCARVYWTVKIWDVANRAINSSNSAAGGVPILPWAPLGNQNYTVEGSCNWPPGSQFQQYLNSDQSPSSAQDPGPTPSSDTQPGPNLSASTPVQVRVLSKKYVQMPWIILFVNQTTADGDFNQSWLVGVRSYCYDFTVSPGVCDVSNGGSPTLPIRNGTEFVFDLPGFYAGTSVEYSVVAVDYAVWDYARDPDYAAGPWDYIMNRVFCIKRPNSCLSSPNYYYHIPTLPPLPLIYEGRLAAQLLKEVYSPSGKRLGLDYILGGCARFENDTWRSQTFSTNEYGMVLSQSIEVRLTPPDFLPIEFRVVATWPCLSNKTVVEGKNIPNVAGPEFTVNATWIIIFANPKPVVHIETTVGWHGMDWVIVYVSGILGYVAPTLFFGVRWFTRRKEMEGAKKAEAEARFKI